MKALCVRWIQDLKKIGRLFTRPEVWFEPAPTEISRSDVLYGFFILFLSMVVSGIIALGFGKMIYVGAPDWYRMQVFFGTPLKFAITLLIMSVILFFGTHFLKAPKNHNVAVLTALRILSIHPFLQLGLISRYGPMVELVVYSLVVGRAAGSSYKITPRNAKLFFGAFYFMLAFIQLRSILR